MTASKNHFDVLMIMQQPPLANSMPREGLDMALVAATFGQQVALLFAGEGIFQLLPGQAPEQLTLKGTHRMLEALPLYDIESIFVSEPDLSDYRLDAQQLLLSPQPKSALEIQHLIASSRTVFSF